MRLDEYRIAITGAGRDFGRSLAIELAAQGAEVFLAARSLAAAGRVAAEIAERGGRAHAFTCDLLDPSSIAAFAEAVSARTERIDVLVNNGAPYLQAPDFESADDEWISGVIGAGATGTVLTTKHFLPLLSASEKPDIVTMVSACGEAGHHRSEAHEAFYAAKSAQAGFTEILSKRLRPKGIRVISLYPPDFENPDRLSDAWETAPRGSGDALTSRSLIDCIAFAIGQPRDCYIKSFHFEQV
ncbi:SDR family oxidoreductase [Glycomyces buryatensis]|uniref:SDR family oxidoreductase n=1 Tax=Glycomyces buryatensis TaxID=2570927 RepID=A0A4S8QIY1_9ACTN|nr:SDR family oxidoreductase [Glycomyces buryatensis]THV41329.1 SDR family oxidoreductase [Glycomyces buryatensis]